MRENSYKAAFLESCLSRAIYLKLMKLEKAILLQ